MAKVEIDNVKMWESIIPRLNNVEDGVYKTFIIDALQDQGLEYKDGHIISIKEPNWTIKEGKYYMCIQNLCPPQTSNQYNFIKDKIYCACGDSEIKDDDGNLAVFLSDYPIAEYFRPATEEEIKGNNGGISPKFKIGNIIKPKGYNEMHSVKDIIFSTEKGAEKYILDNGFIFPVKDEDIWELVEPKQVPDTIDEAYYHIQGGQGKQENIPTFKELERNGKEELTEFEKAIDECVYDFFLHNSQEFSLENCVNKHKDAILEAARKQIASEISIDMFCSNIGYVNGNMNNAYRKGAADMLNKIKEG